MSSRPLKLASAALVSTALVVAPFGTAAAGNYSHIGGGGFGSKPGCTGGSGVTINKPVSINKNVNIFKPTTINNNVNVYKPVTINKDVNVYKPTTINKDVNIYKPTTINKDVNIYKPVTINKDVNIYKPITIEKNIEINKNIDNSKYIDASKNITINKNIEINKQIIINKGGSGGGEGSAEASSWAQAWAQASAQSSAQASAQASANVVVYNGYNEYVTVNNRTGGGEIGAIQTTGQCEMQEANVVKAIHGVCISPDGREFPASHMVGETWLDSSLEGEILRCIPGAHLKIVIGDVLQSDQGLAGTYSSGQALECTEGEALRHFKDGMLKCAPKVWVKDCTERTNLRRWGTADMFFTFRSTVCVTTHTASVAKELELTGMSLSGGVGE